MSNGNNGIINSYTYIPGVTVGSSYVVSRFSNTSYWNIDVAQELGSSEHSVMSQNAVTSAVNTYNVSVLYPTEGYTDTGEEGGPYYDLDKAVEVLNNNISSAQKKLGGTVLIFYTTDVNDIGNSCSVKKYIFNSFSKTESTMLYRFVRSAYWVELIKGEIDYTSPSVFSSLTEKVIAEELEKKTNLEDLEDLVSSLNTYNISVLYPTEGYINTDIYTLEGAISIVDTYLEDKKSPGMIIKFNSGKSIEEYRLEEIYWGDYRDWSNMSYTLSQASTYLKTRTDSITQDYCAYINNISLQDVGDYIEFEVKQDDGGYGNASNGFYSFCGYVSATVSLPNYTIACSVYPNQGIRVRDSLRNDIVPTSKTLEAGVYNNIKIQITELGVKVYINGVDNGEYEWVEGSSKILQIGNFFGSYPAYGIWEGEMRKLQIYSSGEFIIKSDTPNLHMAPGFRTYSNSLSLETESEDEDTEIVTTLNPNIFISWYETYFYIYLKQTESIYYRFKLALHSSRGTNSDELVYSYQWHLRDYNYACRYEDGVMTEIEDFICIREGESENVIHLENCSVIDFTGGWHGDETIDVNEDDFVVFYVDGLPFDTTSAPFLLQSCDNFYYTQKSSLHNTGKFSYNYPTSVAAVGEGVLTVNSDNNYEIDGVNSGVKAYGTTSIYTTATAASAGISVSAIDNLWQISRVSLLDGDHTIIASHIKKTSFSKDRIITEKTLCFTEDMNYDFYWYYGIMCTGKGIATKGYGDVDYKTYSFSGSNDHTYMPSGSNLFEVYNETTGGSGSITSDLILDESGLIDDDQSTLEIWDRTTDSKYYKRTATFTPESGKRMKAIQTLVLRYKDTE